jgi:hypothetical protein
MRGPSPSALLALWLAAAPALATAATSVFLLDTDEATYATIYRVDPESGRLTALGSLPTTLGPTASLAAASDSRLYSVTQSGEVLEIEVEPFGVASLGNVGANSIAALAFSNGALYATEENTSAFYRIELPSLGVTRIGVVHRRDGSTVPILGGDLAESPSGDWYLWSNATEALYLLDARDATATPVPPEPSSLGFYTGLAFDYRGGGALLASSRTLDALVTLDPTTGRSTGSVSFCLTCPAVHDASFGDLASSRCSDRDRDGFVARSRRCGPVDCDDRNPDVYPGASEVCNGVDDDCDRSVDEGVTCLPCPQPSAEWKRRPGAWPVAQMVLGAHRYGKHALLGLLRAPLHGDASLRLARELIAAKLNVAYGADSLPASAAIAAADALLAPLSGALPYRVRPGSPLGRLLLEHAAALAAYNDGTRTPDCAPACRAP